jgi:hypothetical protein
MRGPINCLLHEKHLERKVGGETGGDGTAKTYSGHVRYSAATDPAVEGANAARRRPCDRNGLRLFLEAGIERLVAPDH